MRIPKGASVTFTAFLVCAVALIELGGIVQGSKKLKAAGISAQSSSVPVILHLRISPEQYHMTRLQSAGRLARVVDRTVYMREVSGAQLTELAREGWVSKIESWSGT
jgi:hypothetical protein